MYTGFQDTYVEYKGELISVTTFLLQDANEQFSWFENQ